MTTTPHEPPRGEYRRVYVRMWRGGSFAKLTPMLPSGQALWLYLLTGEFTTNLPGVVRGGQAAMAEALGWDLEAYRLAYAEAYRLGMAEADWEARLVWCKMGLEYNPPQSVNVVKAWWNSYTRLPDCGLKAVIGKEVVAYLLAYPVAFRLAFQLDKGYPRSTKHEGDTLKSISSGVGKTKAKKKTKPKARTTKGTPKVEALVAVWNEGIKDTSLPTMKKLTPGSARYKSARARLREHRNLDEWRTVVARVVTRQFCHGENDSGWVADFEYLVRPGTFTAHWEGKFSQVEKRRPRTEARAKGVDQHVGDADDVYPSGEKFATQLDQWQARCKILAEYVADTGRGTSHPGVCEALRLAWIAVDAAAKAATVGEIDTLLQAADDDLVKLVALEHGTDDTMAELDNAAKRAAYLRKVYDLPRLEM